jgi:hypothetical protein
MQAGSNRATRDSQNQGFCFPEAQEYLIKAQQGMQRIKPIR